MPSTPVNHLQLLFLGVSHLTILLQKFITSHNHSQQWNLKNVFQLNVEVNLMNNYLLLLSRWNGCTYVRMFRSILILIAIQLFNNAQRVLPLTRRYAEENHGCLAFVLIINYDFEIIFCFFARIFIQFGSDYLRLSIKCVYRKQEHVGIRNARCMYIEGQQVVQQQSIRF